MTTTTPDDLRCPHCGGTLLVDTHCTIERVYLPKYPRRDVDDRFRKVETHRAALCNRCDFCTTF